MTQGRRKSPNNVTSTLFNTVYLLPKDLRFDRGGAKLAPCPRAPSNLVTPRWLGLSALTRQCAFARIPPAKILKLSSISFILASLNTSAPAARFYGSEGQIKLLGGKSFCFYYMFKTKFSGHNKKYGGHCPRTPPRGYGSGTPFEVSSRVVCGTHLRLWQHRGWTVFRVFDVTRPGIDPSPCHRRRRVLNQLQPVLC